MASNTREEEKTYQSIDPMVLNDPDVARVLERIRNMPTPTKRTGHALNEEEWRKGLRDYPDKTYKENILKMNRLDDGGGWELTANAFIEAKGPQHGYPGTIAFWHKALLLMEKRMKKGYFLGPFRKDEPLPKWLTDDGRTLINPCFGKIEIKPDGTVKLRLLYDLSNNESGKSFNDCIDQFEKTVTYITILDVVRRIIDCDLKWLWALDALEAYYRVPIQKRFIKYMGVEVCGMLFFFTCLVMGMASACRIYTEFADVVCWIITNNEPELFKWRKENGGGKGKVYDLLMHYIDDFVGGAQDKETAERQFEAVKSWWNRLGIPTQDRKCIRPAYAIRYLGFILDALKRTVSVPEDKTKKYLKKLRWIKMRYEMTHQPMKKRRKRSDGSADGNAKLTMKDLAEFTGQIRSIQRVYPYIVPFVRYIEEAHAGQVMGHRVRVTDRMFKALLVIEEALMDAKRGSIPMQWLIHPKDAGDVEIYTDASTTIGMGGFVNVKGGGHFTVLWKDVRAWNEWKHKPDITYLELLAVVTAVKLYGSTWSGQAIRIWCDNYGVCSVVARKAACFRRRDLNDLMAVMCAEATKYRFYFWIDHIAGDENVVADALSRDKPLEEVVGQQYEPLAARPTDAAEITRKLVRTWTENMNFIIHERAKAKAQCRCDRKHEPTRLLCNRLSREYDQRLVEPKLNRAQRRARKRQSYKKE